MAFISSAINSLKDSFDYLPKEPSKIGEACLPTIISERILSEPQAAKTRKKNIQAQRLALAKQIKSDIKQGKFEKNTATKKSLQNLTTKIEQDKNYSKIERICTVVEDLGALGNYIVPGAGVATSTALMVPRAINLQQYAGRNNKCAVIAKAVQGVAIGVAFHVGFPLVKTALISAATGTFAAAQNLFS